MNGDIIFFSIIAALTTILGGSLPLIKKKINSDFFAALAAGILLSVAFIDMIPNGMILGGSLGIATGFILMYIMEQITMIHVCSEGRCDRHVIGPLGICGITFHSLIDGAAIALGFSISYELGYLVLLSVLIHEFPEGLVTTSLMLGTKYSKKIAFLSSFIVAIATPIGAIVTLIFLPSVPQYIIGVGIMFTAGTFIYVGTSDILPRIHKKSDWSIILTFLIGFLAIIGLHLFI
ncbi:MAG: ZIP family metal transporter [Candidatus Aenigmatarchaeota archaeon]